MKKKKPTYREEIKELKDLVTYPRHHKLSGEAKTAVKNSVYTTFSNLSAKIGSLFYTIILARLLMPELFGLYSLTLSTLVIIVTLTNFGIFNAMVVYVSKELGKRHTGKAKRYFHHLVKLKFLLMVIGILFILLFSKMMANFYQKPIFLGLIAGVLYITFLGITGIFKRAFQAVNDFKPVFYQEVIFQLSRIILVPLAVILSFNYALSKEALLFWVITAISLSLGVATIYLFLHRKRVGFLHKNKKEKALTAREKKALHQFLLAVSATAITGSFFTYIDTLMLGRFVLAEYIGYYAAALSLATAAATVITFSSALLPVFSSMKKDKANKLYHNSLLIILAVAIAAFLFTFILAPQIISIVYGSQYATAIPLLRIFSVLLLIMPLASITSAYIISREKPGLVTISKVTSTVLNIILNYTLITWLIQYGPVQAIYGAATATIISNLFNLKLMLILKKFKT